VRSLDRRTFLASSAGATGVLALGLGVDGSAAAAESDRRYRHGVASGDPWPRSVVLWTRVTPVRSATPGSGLGADATVRWEVAADVGFSEVIRHGVVTTGARRDHTVKVVAGGLRPATTYYYRFVLDGVPSPVGQTRTAPAPDALPRRVRFGVVSCSNWQAGWFAAYRHLAARGDLDAVLHLGDYLYEYGPGEYGYGQGNVDVRAHEPRHETLSLRDFRRRHAQYKTDRDLQALHASCSVTSPTTASAAQCSSPATSTRRGRATCRRTPGPIRPAAAWRPSSCVRR
jgi:alkaline phosphatase D